MICQICQSTLPFKRESDGQYYFESVVFISGEEVLNDDHIPNHLALCPNHAAMFEHANPSRHNMLELFSEIKGRKLDLQLGGNKKTIHFSNIHLDDLRAIIEAREGN